MSRVLSLRGSNWGGFKKNFRGRNAGFVLGNNILSMHRNSRKEQYSSKNRGKVSFGQADLRKVAYIFGFLVFLFGVFYLYQVNDLATKGYEIKEIEKEIASLSEINKNKRIQEVELKSMYNIEKTAEKLNLIGSKGMAYLNISEEVAMK